MIIYRVCLILTNFVLNRSYWGFNIFIYLLIPRDVISYVILQSVVADDM